MAIIQANMQRIDEDNLFEGIEIKPQKQNIATPGQLLIACEINNFPVDLNKILSHLNLSLEEINLDNEISGILNVKKRTIYVEKDHSQPRKNFTIAHELGHYCMHQDISDTFEDKIFLRTSSVDLYESQANKFAAELLMPRDIFMKIIKEDVDTIEKLAVFFNVSTLAVRVRAKQLNLKGHGL